MPNDSPAAATAAAQVSSTAPFNLGYGDQDVPGGAVFAGTQAVYVYSHHGKVTTLRCTPPDGRDPWTNVTPATPGWNSYWSCNITGQKINPGLSTPAVAFPDTNTGSSDIYVLSGDSCAYLVGNDNTVTPIQLQSLGGYSLDAVGATAYGQYLIVGWWWASANQFLWSAYDTTALPSPINPGFVWSPAFESGGIPQVFSANGTALPSGVFGPVASMDWYSDNNNNQYLVTSFLPHVKNPTPTVMIAQMGNPLPTANQWIPPCPVALFSAPGQWSQIMVVRNPAGMMVLSSADENGNPQTLTIPAGDNPFSAGTAWNQIATASNWQSTFAGSGTSESPVPVWVMGESYVYNYSNPNNSPGAYTANRMDIFQMYFFQNPNGHVFSQVQQYGIAEQVPGSVAGSLLPQIPYTSNNQTWVGVTSGIFDAPFPLPASNILNNVNKGTIYAGTPQVTVTYGTSNESSSSHSADFSVGGGMVSSGAFTVGVGPAWSISVGVAESWASGDQSVVSDIDAVSIATEAAADGSVVPFGSAIGSNVSFTGGYYRVLDVNGNPIPGSQQFCSIAPLLGASKPNHFTPYLVTAGDLASYTREQINLKAQTLGLLQSSETDYVANVIEQNALQLGNGQNYLYWSQDYNGSSVSGYLANNQSWSETGWSMHSSAYVGVGFGVSASVATETVAAWNGEVLAGIDLSSSHSKTTETSQQIQIQISGPGLPIAQVPTDIVSLGVRIYFLPANARWMQELKQLGGLQLLDTNSSPWRVFFVVDSYKSQDGSISYP